MTERLSEGGVGEVLMGHRFSVHRTPQPIFDEKPWRMTETVWGCTCGWVGSNEALAKDQIPGDLHHAHLVAALEAHIAARLAPIEALAEQAWSEGWQQGTEDAWANGGHESKPNPYRAALAASRPVHPAALLSVEQACEVMHDAYEAAAVDAGWETQERSRKPWSEVPEANKVTMRAAVSALLARLAPVHPAGEVGDSGRLG